MLAVQGDRCGEGVASAAVRGSAQGSGLGTLAFFIAYEERLGLGY